MRDRYYRIASAADAPDNVALVRIWRHRGRARGRVETGEAIETDPDLALFAAALARIQHDLVAVFVLLDEPDLWRDDWGGLVDYTGRPGDHIYARDGTVRRINAA